MLSKRATPRSSGGPLLSLCPSVMALSKATPVDNDFGGRRWVGAIPLEGREFRRLKKRKSTLNALRRLRCRDSGRHREGIRIGSLTNWLLEVVKETAVRMNDEIILS
jgi:hypothetical protein